MSDWEWRDGDFTITAPDAPKSASDLAPEDVHVPALLKCRCGKELNHAGPHAPKSFGGPGSGRYPRGSGKDPKPRGPSGGGGGPGIGHEMSDAELAKILDDAGGESAMSLGVDTTGADGALRAIVKAQGFDGHPKLVSSDELNAAIAAGQTEMFRGVRGQEYVDAFKTGEYYPGTGVHGNGIYTASGAEGRKEAEGYTGGNAKPMRMALQPGSRITTEAALYKAMEAESARAMTGTPAERALASKAMVLRFDVGRFAASKGYDAYIGAERKNTTYWVVLNRTALMVER